MAKYMIKASYSPEGIKGVMAKGGSARAEAIEKLAAGVGGAVDSVYFSFGSEDLYAIVDAPSNEAMAAIAGTVGQTGVLSSYETVVLLTPAQIDEAANDVGRLHTARKLRSGEDGTADAVPTRLATTTACIAGE